MAPGSPGPGGGETTGSDVDRIPTGYKVWVFGSKLAGVLAFAVGIEMLTRGDLIIASMLLFGGAAIVVAPVRSPDDWGRGEGRRV